MIFNIEMTVPWWLCWFITDLYRSNMCLTALWQRCTSKAVHCVKSIKISGCDEALCTLKYNCCGYFNIGSHQCQPQLSQMGGGNAFKNPRVGFSFPIELCFWQSDWNGTVKDGQRQRMGRGRVGCDTQLTATHPPVPTSPHWTSEH